MPGLEDLYREIILDHYRSPRNRGELPTPPAQMAQGHNPLCGDEITVYLLLEPGDGGVADAKTGDDAIVADIKIAGQGCSISQSSASMMSQAVKGKTAGEAKALIRRFKTLMSIEGLDEQPGDADIPLGDRHQQASDLGRAFVEIAAQQHVAQLALAGVELSDQRRQRQASRRGCPLQPGPEGRLEADRRLVSGDGHRPLDWSAEAVRRRRDRHQPRLLAVRLTPRRTAPRAVR